MEKKELPSIEDRAFLEYLKEKGANHRSYKYYSTIKNVNSCMDKRALFLSDGRNWNDIIDRENFNNEKLDMMNFGRCFSYSTTESVAMWMLYGGMEHRGAMLDFDKNTILSILRSVRQISLGYFGEDEFIALTRLDRKDFEIQLVDVVYTEKKKTENIIRRSTGDIWKVPLGNTILNSERYTIIHKSKAWDYEQECRLIVSIKKDIIRRVKNFNKISMVKIDLKSVDLDNVRRVCSPNVLDEDELESLDKFFYKSDLSKEVDWDLCKGCKKFKEE